MVTFARHNRLSPRPCAPLSAVVFLQIAMNHGSQISALAPPGPLSSRIR